MSRFKGITLPSGMVDKKDETEVRKMGIDILKNLNVAYEELFPVYATTDMGDYIKFPDGTVIAWENLTQGTATQVWTYPLTITGAIVTVTPGTSGAAMGTTSNTATPTTSVNTHCFDAAGAGVTVNRRVMAIGRWK